MYIHFAALSLHRTMMIATGQHRGSLLSRATASSCRAVALIPFRSCSKPDLQLQTLQNKHPQGTHAGRLNYVHTKAVPVEAMATAGTVLNFTPQHAALGGAILGVAVVSNLLICGRVLGISGAVKGLVQDAQGRSEAWRWAFVAGLMAGAPFLATLLPGSFETMAPSVSVARSLISGLLVGIGTSMGNGCTSGHGICGNSRLSVRSMAYTITFMVAGALSATLSNATTALQIAPIAPAFQALTAAERNLGLTLLAGGALLMTAIAATYKALYNSICTQSPARSPSSVQDASSSSPTPTLTPRSSTTGKLNTPTPSLNMSSNVNSSNTGISRLSSVMQVVASAAVGHVFAAGLAMSGMTRPSKVVGFLSALSPSWDLSLMFVMASAIGISIFAFQAVMGTWFKLPPALRTPLLAAKYSLPASSHIDAQLLLGGVLFGAGWGLSGMCPGPAMLVAASPVASSQVWLYIAAMVCGMKLQPMLANVPRLAARVPVAQ